MTAADVQAVEQDMADAPICRGCWHPSHDGPCRASLSQVRDVPCRCEGDK